MKEKELNNLQGGSFKEDPRYKQCNKEALYGVILGLVNMVWWYAFGYGLGGKPVEEYTYILGFPTWFFVSCIVGSVIFIALTFVMVEKGFKDMPLDKLTDEQIEEYERTNNKEVA
ncbi:MAG: YhdT family protein [Sedimentibacter sp.]